MHSTTIVQVSDFHLFADKQECLQGVNTLDSLCAVLTNAALNYAHANAFILTGDLSQDGTAASYTNLKSVIEDLTGVPCFVIPGNHDHSANMQRHLIGGSIRYEPFVDFESWRVYFLNSQVEGSEYGLVRSEEMEALQHNASLQTRNHLICIHHPPVLLNGFIDQSRLKNSDRFFSVLDNIPGQKVVIFGHAHQEHFERKADLILLGAPSTCVQFKPHTPECVKDELTPGYRVLTLDKSGDFNTEIVRLSESEV